MSLDLDAVRRSIDGSPLASETASPPVKSRPRAASISSRAGLEQMTHEIAKFQAVERYVLYKNSDPPPQPAPAQVPKPVHDRHRHQLRSLRQNP